MEVDACGCLTRDSCLRGRIVKGRHAILPRKLLQLNLGCSFRLRLVKGRHAILSRNLLCRSCLMN